MLSNRHRAFAALATLVAVSASAGDGYFDQRQVEPRTVPRDEPCAPAQAWTCTLQCDQGTRTAGERIFGAAGAEACVVLTCSCQRRIVSNGANINDPTLPVAIVVFGVRDLVQK
jgi:hypothetical protein